MGGSHEGWLSLRIVDWSGHRNSLSNISSSSLCVFTRLCITLSMHCFIAFESPKIRLPAATSIVFTKVADTNEIPNHVQDTSKPGISFTATSTEVPTLPKSNRTWTANTHHRTTPVLESALSAITLDVFWLRLPTEGCIDSTNAATEEAEKASGHRRSLHGSVERVTMLIAGDSMA